MNYAESKNLAIRLRKKGLTDSEIMENVPVAKSPISLWLRSVGLSERHKQRITEKKLLAQKRGAAARKNIRIQQTEEIFKGAKNDVEKIIKNPLWLAGVMLYWAEGSKQKENHISSMMHFSNMDQKMIRLFLLWSKRHLNLQKNDLYYDLYIHDNGNIEDSLKYWAKHLGCGTSEIRVYLKRSKPKTVRKNIGNGYHGVIRINIKRSAALNRKVSAWTDHLCHYWGIV